MATFYVLPARPLFEQMMDRMLAEWLPTLPGPLIPAEELTEFVRDHAERKADTFIVYRDELPEGMGLLEGLRDAFGAESGDDVVELHWGPNGQIRARSTRLGLMAAA
ncbi:MAG: hypothetical protein N2039_15310 [Gemmataceae bacterium]|nr:hypothetical protein [Gemmataceae bacterium]